MPTFCPNCPGDIAICQVCAKQYCPNCLAAANKYPGDWVDGKGNLCPLCHHAYVREQACEAMKLRLQKEAERKATPDKKRFYLLSQEDESTAIDVADTREELQAFIDRRKANYGAPYMIIFGTEIGVPDKDKRRTFADLMK